LGFFILRIKMNGFVEKTPESGDLRCCCGSLVARIVKGHVELKCRRCKRIHRIPIDNASAVRNFREENHD
jgi:phage FluMu protein Com